MLLSWRWRTGVNLLLQVHIIDFKMWKADTCSFSYTKVRNFWYKMLPPSSSAHVEIPARDIWNYESRILRKTAKQHLEFTFLCKTTIIIWYVIFLFPFKHFSFNRPPYCCYNASDEYNSFKNKWSSPYWPEMTDLIRAKKLKYLESISPSTLINASLKPDIALNTLSDGIFFLLPFIQYYLTEQIDRRNFSRIEEGDGRSQHSKKRL